MGSWGNPKTLFSNTFDPKTGFPTSNNLKKRVGQDKFWSVPKEESKPTRSTRPTRNEQPTVVLTCTAVAKLDSEIRIKIELWIEPGIEPKGRRDRERLLKCCR